MHNYSDIDILLATYNGETYLEQQLKSIFSQKGDINFKVYVSDDNSTDNTIEILEKFKELYPNKFFFTINKKNIGFIKNFEKLLKKSKSIYIAFADQDDIWEEEKLNIELNTIQNLEALHPDNACLVNSDLSMIDKNNNLLYSSYFNYRKYHLKDTKDLGHIIGSSGIMGNTLLINNKLKELVLPFPEDIDVHDYWIGINCELFGYRKTIFKPLVQYRIHNTNSSNSKDKLNSKSFSISRNLRLPNLETNRKYFLPKLIKKVTNKEDIELLNRYMDYLSLKGNRFIIYFNLIRYSMIKRDILFRIKIFFKLILTNRY